MHSVRPISDLGDPNLAPFRTLRAQEDHLGRGVFVAEGDKIVHRLLASDCEVISVVLPPERLAEFETQLGARSEDIRVYVAPLRVLKELTGFSLFQGVLGLARVPAATDLATLLALPGPHLFAAIDGLSHSENVGALVRNVYALGAQALIVGETSAHPYLRRAVRSSMGTILKLPFVICGDLADAIGDLRQGGVQCLAAHPRPSAAALWETSMRRSTCIVFGAEGQGLRDKVVEACESAVAVPMQPGVDSLNVASAAAVIFGEINRQRRAEGSTRRRASVG